MTNAINYVWMTDISQKLKMASASSCRQWILKQGFQFEKRRNPKTSLIGLCLKTEQLERLTEIRTGLGFYGQEGELAPVLNGIFYIVLPVPEFNPNRVKLGFTTNIQNRLIPYRTICPNAQAEKTWACLGGWEQTAIASITRVECIQVGMEVFDCEDIGRLIERAEQFFAVMPDI